MFNLTVFTMITIFTIPKPFTEKNAIPQLNAIASWMHSCSNPEIIIFGDEEGIEGAANNLGVIHVNDVKKNKYGTPYIHEIFFYIQKIARSDLICYINSDIILLTDIEQVGRMIPGSGFLLTGRRTNLDIEYEIDFSNSAELQALNQHLNDNGVQDKPSAMDYFLFPKGQIMNMPPFVVGRAGWDNWMIFSHKKEFHYPIVDSSESIKAIHQNHDYSHVKEGTGKKWEGRESEKNRSYFQKKRNGYYTLLDADYLLSYDYQLQKIQSDRDIRIHRIKRVINPILPITLASFIMRCVQKIFR